MGKMTGFHQPLSNDWEGKLRSLWATIKPNGEVELGLETDNEDLKTFAGLCMADVAAVRAMMDDILENGETPQ